MVRNQNALLKSCLNQKEAKVSKWIKNVLKKDKPSKYKMFFNNK
jgi:hypothetical protein